MLLATTPELRCRSPPRNGVPGDACIGRASAPQFPSNVGMDRAAGGPMTRPAAPLGRPDTGREPTPRRSRFGGGRRFDSWLCGVPQRPGRRRPLRQPQTTAGKLRSRRKNLPGFSPCLNRGRSRVVVRRTQLKPLTTNVISMSATGLYPVLRIPYNMVVPL